MKRFIPILAALLTAIVPAAARADAREDFQQAQSKQKRELAEIFGEAPELDKSHPCRAIADLLSLSFDERGTLVLCTTLPTAPRGQANRVKMAADADWSMLNVYGGATDAGPVVPDLFALNRTRFNPQSTELLIVQQMKGVSLLIIQQISTPAGQKAVLFQLKYPNPADQSDGFCQLEITDQPKGHPLPAVTCNSPDFSAFTREHPVEFDRYLGPLFHELGQDALMAPNPMLAVEVFLDQWTPDAATIAKVNALVADLGGSDFHARARAQHDLAALGKNAAVVLVHLDRSKLTSEQNARIAKVLSPYQPDNKNDADKLRSDPGFLSTCLYSDDPVIRKAAFAQLQTVTQLKLNFDPNADQAARNAAIWAILDARRKNRVLPNN